MLVIPGHFCHPALRFRVSNGLVPSSRPYEYVVCMCTCMIDHCLQNCEFSTLLQLPFLVLGEVGGMVTQMNTVYLEWFCPLKVMALFQQSVSSHAQMSLFLMFIQN